LDLNNAASKALQEYLTESDIEHQWFCHMFIAEMLLNGIFKLSNHLVVELCSTDKEFPSQFWEKLIPQALLTLNMMRTSKINPTTSSETQLKGFYSFNGAPLVLPSTRIYAQKIQTDSDNIKTTGCPTFTKNLTVFCASVENCLNVLQCWPLNQKQGCCQDGRV
jgi:hypothetical protein